MYFDPRIVAAVGVAVGVALIISILARKKVTSSSSSSSSHIPGSLGLPFIGESFSFLSALKSTRGCYDFVELRRARYGNWFKTSMFGKIHVFVPSTEGARLILSNDFTMFNKGYVKSLIDCVGENSVFTVTHENHERIRRLLSDPFSMKSSSSYVAKFDEILCKKLKEREREGKSFSVFDFIMKILFDALCCMLMSVTDEALLRQLETDITDVSNAIFSVRMMIPGTRYYKGMKARRRLIGTFSKMIASRRSGERPEPEDFLQSMLQRDASNPDEMLHDSEIMDNLITLIIAGQTTTAATLMWCVKYLNENQSVQDILREEQLSMARTKSEGASLTLQDINNLPYCWKVVKEAMRISTVVLFFPRVALDDCIIEGVLVKKGWRVCVDAKWIHNDPKNYSDPSEFNPSRFDEIQKPYSFIPFGSGPRTCLGINMAKMTMIVFMYRLSSAYRWTVDDLDTSVQKNAHFLVLRSGCPITLKAI